MSVPYVCFISLSSLRLITCALSGQYRIYTLTEIYEMMPCPPVSEGCLFWDQKEVDKYLTTNDIAKITSQCRIPSEQICRYRTTTVDGSASGTGGSSGNGGGDTGTGGGGTGTGGGGTGPGKGGAGEDGTGTGGGGSQKGSEPVVAGGCGTSCVSGVVVSVIVTAIIVLVVIFYIKWKKKKNLVVTKDVGDDATGHENTEQVIATGGEEVSQPSRPQQAIDEDGNEGNGKEITTKHRRSRKNKPTIIQAGIDVIGSNTGGKNPGESSTMRSICSRKSIDTDRYEMDTSVKTTACKKRQSTKTLSSSKNAI